MTMDTALAQLSEAKTLLTHVKDFTQILEIRDQAVAMHAYASAKGADEASKIALEVKLRAERKAGQFLDSMKAEGLLSKGGNPNLTVDTMSTVEKPTLKSLGIEHKESQRWQKIAAIPEEKFEDYLQSTKTRTQRALLQLAHCMTAPISVDPPPMPHTLFSVVYADPPWQYEYSISDSRRIENKYPTMTLVELQALTLPITDDAVLFLWATNPKLEEAIQLMTAWGFTYRTNMVWVKNKMGMGYYVRGTHELLLIGCRGNVSPPIPANRFSSVLFAPRREHSIKPVEIYHRIENMYPKQTYLELFARNTRDGWTSWGHELG